ncbi:MAG: iron ABC transporter permease [Rhodobacteraceae bacterium]|nr:iron ABC transporter permease [Paracoccaceae bacterium]
MNAKALLFAVFFPAMVFAQGYAGLGGEAEGYRPVTRPAALAFPRDHGPHPGFRIEWWYLTANLSDADGKDFGIQWTLFRIPLSPAPEAPGWQSNQIWMGHAALTDADEHRYSETFARGGIGTAGVQLAPFRAWIDDWRMAALPGPGDALAEIALTAGGEGFAYDLHASASLPPVPQGEEGYSLKTPGGAASYYYSQPFYAVEGSLELDGRRIAVTGQAWLDREWSSQPLRPDNAGWDWFSLHLATGEKVMAYRFRKTDGSASLAGTWIDAGGRPSPLGDAEIAITERARSTVAGRAIPTAWHVEIPSRGFAVDTEPLNPQSWMGTTFAYWEGPIRFGGSHNGRGYLEMTGYE